jgi:hypothetical protein
MINKIKTIYLTSIVLFCFSLFAPGIVLFRDSSMSPGDQIWYGYDLVINGWIGLFYHQYAWFANVLFICAILVIHYRRYRIGMLLSLGAIIVGLETLLFVTYPDFETGALMVVSYFGPGFYLWELSFCFMLLYSWMASREWIQPVRFPR